MPNQRRGRMLLAGLVLVLAACEARDPAPVQPPQGALQVDGRVVTAAPPVASDVGDRIAELGAVAVAAATPPAASPVWLRIPTIGVDTTTIELDLRRDVAEVPASFDVAGWYRQTVSPGTVGPAVVVGHVGSKWGPGVFDRLDELRPGDEIHVTDADGRVRTFVVDAGALVDKHDRPPEVFGRGADRPELRLITCGGDFDPGTGHHVSNYVVWAHEAGS